MEQKFGDVLTLSVTKLKKKGESEFGCEWKDVRCNKRESKGRSGLNSESGGETVCGGMKGSVIKANVGESKVW